MPSIISAPADATFFPPASAGQLLSLQAAARPEKEALVCGLERLSYGVLEARAEGVSAQLSELGIGSGDRVGLLFPNQAGYVWSFFGASRLGATVVPINPLLKADEIAHILADSQAKAVIIHESALTEALLALSSLPAISYVLVSRTTSGKLPAGQRAGAAQLIDLAEGHLSKSLPPAMPITDPASELAVLVYTSGTTGRPKGAMLTHHNLTSAIGNVLGAFRMTDSDRCLAVLPLCHIYGLTVVMLASVSSGGTLVIVEKFDAARVLATIEKEKVTLVPAVPAMYQFMLKELETTSYDLSPVRMCLSGGAALPIELIASLEAHFGAPLVEGYGMTESACVATANPLEGVRKPGSVGPAVSNMAVAILAEDGRQLPPSPANTGEVALKGPNIMRGYYQRPEASAECLRDGWLLTGDLGYKDEDGYLFLVGRKKELIIRGGQNIYPREIEEVISRMPQVLEVAVIGVPDRYMGERVKAVVALRPGSTLTSDEVKDYCREKLAEYKVPRLVEFVAALPRNSTGKILKRLL